MTRSSAAVARTTPDCHADRPCLERLNADMPVPARHARSQTRNAPALKEARQARGQSASVVPCRVRRVVSSLHQAQARHEPSGRLPVSSARGAGRTPRPIAAHVQSATQPGLVARRPRAPVSGPDARGSSGGFERQRSPPRRRRARESFRPCKWHPRRCSGGSTSAPDHGSRRKSRAACCKIPARVPPRQLYPSPTSRSTAPLSHVAHQLGCYKRDSVKSS